LYEWHIDLTSGRLLKVEKQRLHYIGLVLILNRPRSRPQIQFPSAPAGFERRGD